jgi:hypothetical protein
MNKTLLQWQEVEVTPEEEEVWQNFLTKYNDNPPKKENIETTIPMEKKDGVQ